MDSLEQIELMSKLAAIRRYLNRNIFEREEETNGILQTILAKSSCFFIGSPGTAKTDHITLAGEMFGLSVFDILLTETTKPDTVFGPTDIPALAKGIQRIKTDGYAPGSEVLFFDEIFKANGVVLNPLLTLINENKFRNGDEGVLKTPTMAVFAASNEIPTDQGLAAIYDRFVLRFRVDYLRSRKNLRKMITRNVEPNLIKKPPAFTREDVLKLQELTRSVKITAEIQELVIKTRDQAQRACHVSISDRRLAKSFRFIQASALLNKRTTAEPEDTEVLANIFWEKLDQVTKVRSIAMAAASADVADLLSYEEIAQDVWETAVKTGEMEPALAKLRDIYGTTKEFSTAAGKTVSRRILERIQQVKSILDQRGDFIILEMHSAKGVWYKLTMSSATVWSATQLRSVKFHWKKKEAYWWHEGPGKVRMSKRMLFRKQLRRKVKATLGVMPRVKRVG